MKRHGLKSYGLLTAAVGLTVAILAVASPAWAAFPGNNGKISFTKVPTTFQNQEIWAVDSDGTNPINLTNNPALDTHAAWSADGTKIAFTSARDGNNEIYTMNADGTNQTNVSNSLKDEILPAWSPDDTKIAFRSDRDGNPEIYTMNADGSNPTRLTNVAGEDSVPAWSADGTKIAFTSARSGNYEIYTMNATDGTEQTNLSNDPAVDLHPAWSPDGTEIAFESTRAGNYEIFKMNATDGSSPTNLSNNPRTEAEPDWSPDGTKIVFRSQRDNDNEIYTMNATDGSDPRNISNDLGMIDYWPSWQPLEGDTAAPQLNLPEDITNEATGPEGAPVSWQAPTATDENPADPQVSCDADSGDTFPIGTTTVGCSATDAAGNIASGSFTVTVQDTTKPTLNLPDNITEESTGPNGKVVNYSTSATDLVGGSVNVTCSPVSGDTFSIKTTAVNCSATDAAGNTASGSFDVTVQDTTAPKVTRVVPAVDATGIAPGANVSAFFSEAMRTASINTNSVKLFKAGTTTPIGAVVSYDASTKRATLNPNANLSLGTRYMAVVTTGSRDLAGNQLDQDQDSSNGKQQKVWLFTVRN